MASRAIAHKVHVDMITIGRPMGVEVGQEHTPVAREPMPLELRLWERPLRQTPEAL